MQQSLILHKKRNDFAQKSSSQTSAVIARLHNFFYTENISIEIE